MLDDRPMWRETTIRRALPASAVTLANVSAVRVHAAGKPTDDTDLLGLRQVLSTVRDDIIEVELIHHRAADGATATRRTLLRFDVPDPASLRSVDEMFIQHVTTDPLRFDPDVLRFDRATKGLKRAGTYRCALADYATGMCARAGDPSTTLSRQEADDKLRAAAATLRDYEDRPVARLALTAARIALGDAGEPFPYTGVARLDRGAAALRRLAGQTTVAPDSDDETSRSEVPLCPVDPITATLVDALATMDSGPGQEMLRGLAGSTGGVEGIIARSALLSAGAPVDPALVPGWRRSIKQDGSFAGWMEQPGV